MVTLFAPVSYPTYKRYRETGLFSATLSYLAPLPFGIAIEGRTERVWGDLVTPSYFSTLGVEPSIGRALDPDNEQPGQPPNVVISYRFWQNHRGSDPAIIGKPLRINGRACNVIGVGPPNFLGASPAVYAANLWISLFADPGAARNSQAIFSERATSRVSSSWPFYGRA